MLKKEMPWLADVELRWIGSVMVVKWYVWCC